MLLVNPNKCPQNHQCPLVAKCPVDAITQIGNGLPVIDSETCILCGTCVDSCPKGAIYEA